MGVPRLREERVGARFSRVRGRSRLEAPTTGSAGTRGRAPDRWAPRRGRLEEEGLGPRIPWPAGGGGGGGPEPREGNLSLSRLCN